MMAQLAESYYKNFSLLSEVFKVNLWRPHLAMVLHFGGGWREEMGGGRGKIRGRKGVSFIQKCLRTRRRYEPCSGDSSMHVDREAFFFYTSATGPSFTSGQLGMSFINKMQDKTICIQEHH